MGAQWTKKGEKGAKDTKKTENTLVHFCLFYYSYVQLCSVMFRYVPLCSVMFRYVPGVRPFFDVTFCTDLWCHFGGLLVPK